MRSWAPIPPICLDRKRLLGEHLELHSMFVIISENRTGYRNHPEVKRWKGHLASLAHRHDLIVAEMRARGYCHKSPLAYHGDLCPHVPETWEPIETMRKKLAEKQKGSFYC